MIAATRHDVFALQDYARARERGLLTVRDGLRWHLIEQVPGHHDFTSVIPMIRAAHQAGVQVIWDLCHYGWPDDLDIFSPGLCGAVCRHGQGFIRVLTSETDAVPFLSPVNEISFFSWAAGEVGYIFPHAHHRGHELKAQLVRAAIAAMEEVWDVAPNARFVHPDPAIHICAPPDQPDYAATAHAYTLSMYEGWDMISGRLHPELGGQPRYLDIVGMNYYPYNQWEFRNLPFTPSLRLSRDDPRYRPFRDILRDIQERYGRPLLLAETGADGEERAEWLRYIGQETQAAMESGVSLTGVCLYPVVNFPWWDDGHNLHTGLWDYADASGERPVCEPLAQELFRQQCATSRLLPHPAE